MRLAGYCRVSTDHADQLNSLEAQQRYFTRYIVSREGWELFRIYADEGISGTGTRRRTEFRRMMEDAYEGKFDLIITKEVSRFSRNILDTIACTRELKSMGIGVLFLTDGINTLDGDAELRLSIMASIAQEESRKTSLRVKWGQTRQMEQGVVFGRSMLGYDVKNGALHINPEGADLVRLIFQKYAVEKKGTSVIARELKEGGYKTYHGNSAWSSSHIIKILKNEKYVGDLIQKKSYTPDFLTHEKKPNRGAEEKIVLHDHHAPIIDRALWQTVQQELVRRNRHRQSGGSNRYPCSGKIKCGLCGASFISRIRRTKSGTTQRWMCYTAAISGRDGCSIGRTLRNDTAVALFAQALEALKLDPAPILRQIAALLGDSASVELVESMLTGRKGSDALVKALLESIIVESDGSLRLKFRHLPHLFIFSE